MVASVHPPGLSLHVTTVTARPIRPRRSVITIEGPGSPPSPGPPSTREVCAAGERAPATASITVMRAELSPAAANLMPADVTVTRLPRR